MPGRPPRASGDSPAPPALTLHSNAVAWIAILQAKNQGDWLDPVIPLIGEEGEGAFWMLCKVAGGGAQRAVRGCHLHDSPQGGPAQHRGVVRQPRALVS